jgi:hypothetical protein
MGIIILLLLISTISQMSVIAKYNCHDYRNNNKTVNTFIETHNDTYTLGIHCITKCIDKCYNETTLTEDNLNFQWNCIPNQKKNPSKFTCECIFNLICFN